MRRSKKIIIFMSMLIICMFGLSACGEKVADEEQIKTELQSETKFRFLEEGEQIEEVVIEKRQTEKKQKTDTVWCVVTTGDTEVSCKKNVILSYGLYDKAGWVLDNVEVESRDKWIMTPLKGIEKRELPALLFGQVLNIDDEEWVISGESLIDTKIGEQQTDLEQKIDQITILLTLDDKFERAEGKIDALFTFNQEWKFDSIISIDDFTVSMKEEYIFHVSESDLMARVIETELPVGETKQKTSASKQEISEFKIEEQKAESKGSRQIYRCSYQVDKSKIVLAMESLIAYTYQDGKGWIGSENETTSKIVSTDIAGDWSGTYRNGFKEETAELHISEIENDGKVTATYAFAQGSYVLSGNWNQEGLTLQMEAGEWVDEPEKIRISNDKDNMTGELNLEKDRLEVSTRQGFIYFTKK